MAQLLRIIVCLAVGLIGGCASPIGTPGGPVPLKVWLVLDTGETPGNIGNNGCRLDPADIVNIVDAVDGQCDDILAQPAVHVG